MRTAKTLAAIDLRIPRREPFPAWLPVPAPRRVRTAPQRPLSKPHSLLMPSRGESGLEKLFLGLLVVAAVIGVGYGFSCLVDLVQNWALFGAGVGHLIQ